MNFFEVLGLNPNQNYSKEDLKKRYRELAKLHHPDTGGDPEKFRQVDHAYKMLTDPSYRAGQVKNTLNLNINFQVPVDFEDAFFGRNITVCYNKFEVFEDGKLVIKKDQDIITLVFTYPPGFMQGHNMTLPGGGLKHKDRHGDGIINFVVKQHPRYQVDPQGNIYTQEKVELEIMLKGGKIEVQTLWGLKTVKIPPGTCPGEKVRISNCGVLQRANHFVEPQPIFPTKDELKNKIKFNDLGINWQDFQEEQQEKQNVVVGYYIGVNPPTGSSK